MHVLFYNVGCSISPLVMHPICTCTHLMLNALLVLVFREIYKIHTKNGEHSKWLINTNSMIIGNKMSV